jgi:site-specific DNA-methyltransferase (adenine-specific)
MMQWLTGRILSEQDCYCTVDGACDIVRLPRRIEALTMRNKLFCGDNLDVLRHCIADESIDLVYLDPPFKSDQDYNLLFREKDGSKSASQILAFEDTWEWNLEAQRNYESVVQRAGKPGQVMAQFRTMLGDTDMLAYLSMMAPRLVELQRALKQTGALYLHCDPTASHYLKLLLDAIFGPTNFKNEIVWQRTNAHNTANQFGRIHDILLFYVKHGEKYTWNEAPTDYGMAQLKRYKQDKDGRWFTGQDLTASRPNSKSGKFNWRGVLPPPSRGWGYEVEQLEDWWKRGLILCRKDGKPRMDGLKVYLEDMSGKPLQSVWTDITRIPNTSKERLPYPTQKPQALLERIITVSSNPGDTVLDPFCGCGTAIEAADSLKRRWIGIDITIQAMRVTRNERLNKFGDAFRHSYDVIYRPCDITAAEAFASEQPFQFQDWAVEKLDGIPSRPRSGDRGIDGRLYFREDAEGPLRQILVSVKGGKLKSTFVRELQGAVARERAPMGVLIVSQKPTKQMIRDAASSGLYSCSSGKYPKIQIITVKDILGDVRFDLPPIQRMEESRKRTLAADAATQLPLPGIAS